MERPAKISDVSTYQGGPDFPYSCDAHIIAPYLYDASSIAHAVAVVNRVAG
jgi:hypothetical protein